MSDTGRPLPKFGEWDVNDPASAESFTVIFNKARNERKTGTNNEAFNSPFKEESNKQENTHAVPKCRSRLAGCCPKIPAASYRNNSVEPRR